MVEPLPRVEIRSQKPVPLGFNLSSYLSTKELDDLRRFLHLKRI
jgi:hypothetical protein